MPRPVEGTFQPYASVYISKVTDDNVADAFKNQRMFVSDFFGSITEEKSSFSYASGKWTLKEMLQHIIDTERIFAFRALCIARGEKQDLPGFNENEYSNNSKANNREWQTMIREFRLVRETTEMLFQSFSENTLQLSGKANGTTVTVNAIGFITVGHLYHHMEVIQERYL
jgi:hypothetical protein